jgi:hypothetical protein
MSTPLEGGEGEKKMSTMLAYFRSAYIHAATPRCAECRLGGEEAWEPRRLGGEEGGCAATPQCL